MEEVLQLLVSGLAMGTVYSLIALGFSLMIRSVNLINFAQGDLVMIGGFFCLSFFAFLNLPFLVAFVLAIILTGLVGVLMERLALRPILRSRAPALNLTIAVLGIGFAFRAAAILIWGADPIAFPPIVGDDPVFIFGARIHPLNLYLLGLGLFSMIVLHLFFQKTLTGISWRAGALKPDIARLMGVSIKRNMILTFGLSGIVGGAAGVLVAPLYFASFNMGVDLNIKAFAAATLGGFSIVGALLGGLIIGVMENFVVVYLSPGYRDAITFGILLALLVGIYKPQVLSGQSMREKLRAVKTSSSQLMSSPRFKLIRLVIVIAGLLVWLLVIPNRSGIYQMHLINMSLIYAIAALGLQLITGFTGQISLGHAAFFGVGAYASALGTMELGLPFPLAFLFAIVLTGMIGAFISPILRLRGFYMAMGTLALGKVVHIFMINWMGITRGPYGIYGIPAIRIGGMVFNDYTPLFFLFTGLIAIQLLIFSRITRYKCGRSLIAVRENERAGAASGINLAYYQAVAFIVGCASAGAGGALYAHYQSYISPDSFTLTISINFLIMVVIGGLGSIPGAILGAFLMVMAPEYLRFVADYRMVVFGGVLVSFMIFLPGGLAQIARMAISFLERMVLKQKTLAKDD